MKIVVGRRRKDEGKKKGVRREIERDGRTHQRTEENRRDEEKCSRGGRGVNDS